MSTMFLLFDHDYHRGENATRARVTDAMLATGTRHGDIVVMMGETHRCGPSRPAGAGVVERRLRAAGWRVEHACPNRPIGEGGLSTALISTVARTRPRRIAMLDPGGEPMRRRMERLASRFWRPVDLLDREALLRGADEALFA